MQLASETANQIIDADDLACSCFLFFFASLLFVWVQSRAGSGCCSRIAIYRDEDYANREMHVALT